MSRVNKKKNSREVPTGNTCPVGPEEEKVKDKDFETKLWCFTSYNENPFVYNQEVCQYLGYEREICPKTNKLHWQGFVYLNDKVSVKRINKILMMLHPKEKEIYKPVHSESCRGSFLENVKYCSKDGSFVEFGTKPSQGQRVDLLLLRDEIKEGTSVRKIRQANPIMYHQYGRTLEKLEDDKLSEKKRCWETKTTGIWLWGPSGCGKSKQAFDMVKNSSCYEYANDDKWWDSYTQQEFVIIDDYRLNTMKFNELIKLVDWTPLVVCRRGKDPIQFLSKKVIITCPYHPDDVFEKLDEDMVQIYRRFEIIKVEPS